MLRIAILSVVALTFTGCSETDSNPDEYLGLCKRFYPAENIIDEMYATHRGKVEKIEWLSFYWNKKLEGISLVNWGNDEPVVPRLDKLIGYEDNGKELGFSGVHVKGEEITAQTVDKETFMENTLKDRGFTIFTFDKEKKHIKVWDFSPNLREQIGYECVEYPITDEIRT